MKALAAGSGSLKQGRLRAKSALVPLASAIRATARTTCEAKKAVPLEARTAFVDPEQAGG
jgi:hypothetical protein